MLETVLFEELKNKLFPFEDEVVLTEKLIQLGFEIVLFKTNKNGATSLVVKNIRTKSLITELVIAYNEVTKKMIIAPNVTCLNENFPRLMLISDDESFYKNNPEIPHALDLLYGTTKNIFYVYSYKAESSAKKELEESIGFNQTHMRNPILFYFIREKGFNTFSKKQSKSVKQMLQLEKLLSNIISNKRSVFTLKAKEEVALLDAFYREVLFSAFFSFKKTGKENFYSMLENQAMSFIGVFYLSFMIDRVHYNLHELMQFFEEKIKPYFKKRLLSYIENLEDITEMEQLPSKAKSLLILTTRTKRDEEGRRVSLDAAFILLKEGLFITKSRIEGLDEDLIFNQNKFLSKNLKEDKDIKNTEESEEIEKGEDEIPF